MRVLTTVAVLGFALHNALALGHRGGVTERYAEFAPDFQREAIKPIQLFWDGGK